MQGRQHCQECFLPPLSLLLSQDLFFDGAWFMGLQKVTIVFPFNRSKNVSNTFILPEGLTDMRNCLNSIFSLKSTYRRELL